MDGVHARTVLVILLSACIAGSGCTTTRNLPRPQAATDARAAGLGAGDVVVVTLASGDIRTLRITAIEADALVGGNTRIAYADIIRLRQKQPGMPQPVSIAKVAGVVLVTGAVVWFAAMKIRAHNECCE